MAQRTRLAAAALAILVLSNPTLAGAGATPTSVLERVLAAISRMNTTVRMNGIFANIAENLGKVDASGKVEAVTDGSVLNVMSGLSTTSAEVGATVRSIDDVRLEIGDITTTVLGAVGTGVISMGVNSQIYLRVSSGLRQQASALQSRINLLGASAGQQAVVLNVTSNQTAVMGRVSNMMTGVNGTIGPIASVVLGAVNTATITSGVNVTTRGIVSGIVGPEATP